MKSYNLPASQLNLEFYFEDGKKFQGYIWSLTANKNISENGFHTAILFNNKVYDNIHIKGISYQNWIKDFEMYAGITPTIKQIDF